MITSENWNFILFQDISWTFQRQEKITKANIFIIFFESDILIVSKICHYKCQHSTDMKGTLESLWIFKSQGRVQSGVKGSVCLSWTVGMSTRWPTKKLKIGCATWSPRDHVFHLCHSQTPANTSPLQIWHPQIWLGVESGCFGALTKSLLSIVKMCIHVTANCLRIRIITVTPTMKFACLKDYKPCLGLCMSRSHC